MSEFEVVVPGTVLIDEDGHVVIDGWTVKGGTLNDLIAYAKAYVAERMNESFPVTITENVVTP